MNQDSTPELLIGKTLKSVEISDRQDAMEFTCEDGESFRAYHMQDCCEEVSIYDISGDLASLIGSPIVAASSDEDSVNWPVDAKYDNYVDSFTWTMHSFQTESGAKVVVRWLGLSNGWYSESVYFQRTHQRVDGFSIPE